MLILSFTSFISKNMDKKLVIITGASSGIGEALAKAFSNEGHPLLLIARRKERLDALQLPNTMSEKIDVTNRADFHHAVQKAEKQFGPTDLLINNAGFMLLGDAKEQDPSEWDKMVEVNIQGVMNGVHSVFSKMIDRKKGTIVNISSTAGIKTFPQHAAYCATKFAVRGFSESLREEASPHNVRVITISPGVVKTELLGHTTSDQIIEGYINWAKESKIEMMQSEDVANAILFAYKMPQRVCIREIVLAPTAQAP